MTWLAPLYLAGALAIAAPILFHMWRRTPRGKRTFSTLMFLTPSPPRVTSLSKLEHWSLLSLRALALLLLALAFARPVLRIPATLPIARDETEFLAILVDTSASLQRDGAWPQVQKLINDRLGQLSPGTVVGLFHVDDTWATDLSLTDALQLEPGLRQAEVTRRLDELKPTWRGTHLGEGLVRTAQAVQEAQAGRAVPCPQRIWLVTDLQEGSNLTALREFAWPHDLPVEWVSVPPARANAGLQLVAASSDSQDDRLRVRVTNAASATQQRFQLVWGDDAGTPCMEIVVPPGQGRVVALPAAPTEVAGRSLILKGDAEPFDNRLWLPVRQPQQCTVMYLGSDKPDQTEGLRYYIDRALASNPRYDVTVVDATQPILSATPPVLAVLTDALPEGAELVPKLLAAGTNLLLVPKSAEAATTLAAWCGEPTLKFSEATGDDYALWADIDFESPWFAPFAEAQFADFSGIHFWKHRILSGDLPARSQVFVRFDDQSPAILQWPAKTGSSTVTLWTSGWHPADSQLSRSSKFVPLMWGVLEDALGGVPPSSAQTVGVPLRRTSEVAADVTVKLPDGREARWPAMDANFRETNIPGRYEILAESGPQVVACNLPPEESRTDAMSPDQLEALGVRLSTAADRPALPTSATQLRQQQVQELEQRQHLWKWTLLTALGLIMLETLLSAYWQRRQSQGLEPASAATSVSAVADRGASP